MAQCYIHPEVPGVGMCMRCKAVICGACATRLEGINHCHACLKALAARPVKLARPRSAWWDTAWVVAVFWGVLCGFLLLARGGLAP